MGEETASHVVITYLDGFELSRRFFTNGARALEVTKRLTEASYFPEHPEWGCNRYTFTCSGIR